MSADPNVISFFTRRSLDQDQARFQPVYDVVDWDSENPTASQTLIVEVRMLRSTATELLTFLDSMRPSKARRSGNVISMATRQALPDAGLSAVLPYYSVEDTFTGKPRGVDVVNIEIWLSRGQALMLIEYLESIGAIRAETIGYRFYA